MFFSSVGRSVRTMLRLLFSLFVISTFLAAGERERPTAFGRGLSHQGPNRPICISAADGQLFEIAPVEKATGQHSCKNILDSQSAYVSHISHSVRWKYGSNERTIDARPTLSLRRLKTRFPGSARSPYQRGRGPSEGGRTRALHHPCSERPIEGEGEFSGA